jgi:zeaxanthin glucosyltransferase
MDSLNGEPLIYALIGTLQNSLEPVFTTIAEAVGERTGTQLVMSIGRILDVTQIKSLPKNAIVVNRAPDRTSQTFYLMHHACKLEHYT